MTARRQNHAGGHRLALGLLTVLLTGACSRDGSPDPDMTSPSFVGRAACATCHEAQHDLWRGSHHDLALQTASNETVLGDFDDASLTHFGVTSTFFRRRSAFTVRTEGPDGAPHDYEVRYTLGVTPLQQYVVEFPGGRFQVLSLCWDARPADAGGQRWFHLYPDERITPVDPLHWTGPEHKWNFMCAECHSTDLRRNYDLDQDRYATTWSEIDVSCEACHGPGSAHVAWAEAHAGNPDHDAEDTLGLVLRIRGTDPAAWIIAPETGQAKRAGPLPSRQQIETCARCHSRRAAISAEYEHGHPLLDTHELRLLDQGLYHADGQILDEVYVYGSFLQSRMYQEGVVCSDCHEPHSLELRTSGNGLCYRCHLPTTFDTPSHHHHQPGSEGASCVACHMPSRTYMVMDRRHDHGFRVPRPDLSPATGAPNACNACHADRSTRWAAEAVAKWYGPDRRQEPHWGVTFRAAERNEPEAQAGLARISADPALPGIVRASALSRFAAPFTPASRATILLALGDEDPLVRFGALGALEELPPQDRVAPGWPLLDDPIRAVRIEAARVLAPAWSGLPAAGRRDLERAVTAYVDAQLANADRPLSHANIGVVLAEIDRKTDAERAYRTAMRLGPGRIEPWVNLADLFRMQGDDGRAAAVLEEAVGRFPRSAEVQHALGLLRVRQRRGPEALASLRKAAELKPEDPHLTYVHAVALNTYGDSDRAIAIAFEGHHRHPSDLELLYALATFHRDRGEFAAAVGYAERLAALAPGDQTVRLLLEALRAAKRP